MYDQMEVNVRRGMAWCDREFGRNWIWRTDVDNLALHNPCRCVLGQNFGDFYDAMYVIGNAILEGGIEDIRLTPDGINWAQRHGFFILNFNKCGYHYIQLTATWKRLILEAREQRKLTTAAQPLESETERVL